MSSSKGRDRPAREEQVCRAIRLLARNMPAATVAETVRVMPSTLERWQKNADFRALLACMRQNGHMKDVLAQLEALTPGAIEALHRALESDDNRVAVQAARDVLDRIGAIRRTPATNDQSTERVIRLEYVNPTGKPYATAPWADRHPRTPGALQSGGVRSPVRENGDGQDSAD